MAIFNSYVSLPEGNYTNCLADLSMLKPWQKTSKPARHVPILTQRQMQLDKNFQVQCN